MTPVVNLMPVTPEEPTPLMREVPEGEPYPVDALGPLRAVAQAVQERTQAPLALGAQSALGVAALAAQPFGDVETLAGSAPISLFALSIAQSGERKSTCDKLLMRPVFEYQRELSASARDDEANHQNELDLWQNQRRAILGGAKNDSIGAAAHLRALGSEPAAPLSPLVVATDPTLEGLIRGLSQYRPSLGIFSDEGGSFIGGSGMSDENRLKTAAGLSSFWDGSPINRTRGGDGAATYYGKRLSVHLMAQPVAAAGLLADPIANGQGLLARFLITHPPSTIGTRMHREPSAESLATIDRFGHRIGQMLRAEMPIKDGTRNELDPPVIGLEPAARALLSRFADRVEASQAKGQDFETVRPFASKAAEHAARIAGVMTCYLEESAVSMATMTNAVNLASFYLGEAKRLADAAEISKETLEAEKLRLWLVDSWREPCISPAIAAQRGPFRETAKVKKLLKVLVAYGSALPIEAGAEVAGKHRREAFLIVRGVK